MPGKTMWERMLLSQVRSPWAVRVFVELNKSPEGMTALKAEFILGRDIKTPTALPKSIPIAVPGPSSSTPSTSKRQPLMPPVSFHKQ